MLDTLFIVAAMQSAALIPNSPPEATPPLAAHAAAKPAKPRRKKCENSEDADTGSHIFMDVCPTNAELARKELEGERHYRQSAVRGLTVLPGAPH